MNSRDPGICLRIWNIPYTANNWDVTLEIAKVLHSDDSGNGRLLNFRVKLDMSDKGGIRNKGTGTLTLPIKKSGYKFLDYIESKPIKMEGRKLGFSSGKNPSSKVVRILAKTPYVSPKVEKAHQDTLRALEGPIRVDVLQFGVFYCDEYPCEIPSFSIEWERRYNGSASYANLSFEYNGRLLRIQLGSPMHDSDGYSVSINFSSIHKIYVPVYARPYICFELLTPAVLDKSPFHRTLTGDSHIDNEKYKSRVASLDDSHKIVSPYAPHLRLELARDEDLESFTKMCDTAGIASTIVRIPRERPLRDSKKAFFTKKRLDKLEKEFGTFHWSVAFQLEALLHNARLNTDELDELLPYVRQHSDTQPRYMGELLRRYSESLRGRKSSESPKKCFQETVSKFVYSESEASTFCCCHITITPTRLLLEGPYATEENRVIRRFSGYKDNFIRVDFRDEDRLNYRWKREVNSTHMLNSRVRDTLKNGFELAGRRFEFLAYSGSSLREHTVWFMTCFTHPEEHHVTPDSIRGSLGDFEGDPTLKIPAKYAARLGQAFTATEETVEIHRSEWEEVDDLGPEKSPHTDGVGTISKALGKRIWHKLCDIRRTLQLELEPSAYQIRFLGYKGVVAVDEELDRSGSGIHMRLRPSMRKFSVKNDTRAPMEIAKAFRYPGNVHLNRALVMVLEDLGVRKEVFLDLQRLAVAKARTINNSLETFEETITSHKMGSVFHLEDLLKRLRADYSMDLKSMDNPFFQEIRRVAMYSILRDILFRARVPLPKSYMLVGVADEGPAYEARGYKDVYCLPEGHIFACIQRSTDPEPVWLEGAATISRSPITHIGDVQRVRLIGKPPKDKRCFFAHLRNVVVMPSKGERPLASCLAGGDLDGDEFSVICDERLLPTFQEDAASYDAVEPRRLERNCTVEDICDFIVEYIQSDVLGLLSDKLLVIADQSMDGMRDLDCQYIAQLCSQAVDYPKRGVPVLLDDSVPKPPIRYKPDWSNTEVVDSPLKTDYYESSRALGVIFRDLKLQPENLREIAIPEESHCIDPMTDSITAKLFPKVEEYLKASAYIEEPSTETLDLFKRYQDELRYTCTLHTLSNTPGSDLLEAEVVIGTILAKCSQNGLRRDRIYRMRHHADTLVQDIKRVLRQKDDGTSVTQALKLAWQAWNFSVQNRKEFAANSFGIIALSTIFNCFDDMSHCFLFVNTECSDK